MCMRAKIVIYFTIVGAFGFLFMPFRCLFNFWIEELSDRDEKSISSKDCPLLLLDRFSTDVNKSTCNENVFAANFLGWFVRLERGDRAICLSALHAGKT